MFCISRCNLKIVISILKCIGMCCPHGCFIFDTITESIEMFCPHGCFILDTITECIGMSVLMAVLYLIPSLNV